MTGGSTGLDALAVTIHHSKKYYKYVGDGRRWGGGGDSTERKTKVSATLLVQATGIPKIVQIQGYYKIIFESK